MFWQRLLFHRCTANYFRSYGVVLWEIVTLGNQPYMGLTNEQVCQYIVNGGCLNQPEGCHPIL